MKVVSYNVNGIRSALSKGFIDFIKEDNADVYCLQESKAQPDQIDHGLFEQAGYQSYWHSAEKKGYSGVVILSKQKPVNVVYGCGNDLYDREGRVIRADFNGVSVMSVYMPSGTTGEVRQSFKMDWLHFFFEYVNNLKKEIPHLIVCGDYNICHRAIDIHDPKGNANSSGFLPEEREWMENFFNAGWTDSFRQLNADPNHYTWWSFRANSRSNNKGWRIDYCAVAESLKSQISKSYILPDAKHSDHCPTAVELAI
jgi:exodeoxyribonuclease-3